MNVAIIVAGGTGERLGEPGGKQLLSLAGRPVLAHTLDAFERCSDVEGIVVVVHPERVEEYRTSAGLGTPKLLAVVAGGDSRADSVAAGIAAIPHGADVIVVHDGARPLVTPGLISASIAALLADDQLDGVVVGHPSYDTLKRVAPDGTILATEDRGAIWAVQTPQVFRARVLIEAYREAAALGVTATDDAGLVERVGGRIRLLEGPRDNVKVTVPEDVIVTEALLAARIEEGS